MKNSSKLLAAVSSVTLVALSSAPAFAAPGTKVGETITNEVTVDFQVGGVDQTEVVATDDVAIDRKVNVTVAEVGDTTTSTTPGAPNAVTVFQVTNLTNDVVDFDLTAVSLNGTAAPNGGPNSTFDVSNIRIYLDDGGTPGEFDGTNTLVTYLDEVPAEGEAGSIVTVLVVAEVPLGVATGATAVVSLEADAHAGGTASSLGGELTNTAGANNAALVDTVLADLAGDDDAAGDGAFSDRDDYTVQAAALSATKSSRIISDPINGVSADAKAIPGAVIEYCIIVSNASGSATATSVAISDPVPAETTFNAGTIRINGTVDGTGYCAADGAAGGTFGSNTVSATLNDLAGGAQSTLVFQATID
ncbi:DUF11 domain-containing protein [Altererythrobacter sp. ZODW24]|uniref:DUF11 domain-containing protein n=1 Tax=Altererythrobacter sp. ZODW24 TaxID=2185142 RepID=UPI000DF7D2BD|nr:DUF11 domain-containing protein [Altererythrobacter sp. ZODW24]